MINQSTIDLNTEFDAVLIGSGPINIIEAAFLKSQGKRVLIIEEREHPAGAWTTIKHENIPEVEIGCHIWDVDKETYDFLARFFKLNLVPLNPRPRINKKKIRFPYDWKMNAIGAKQILKRTGKLEFKALKNDFKTPRYRLSALPSLYMYPKNGAKDIKEAIQNTIDAFEIPILYNTRVDFLSYQSTEDKIKFGLKDGTQLSSKECVLTSLSSIDSFKIDENSFEFAYKTMDYVHMHLILNNYDVKRFSYDRIMDSPVVHRVSDMTSQVKDDIPKDSCLLCVGIFETPFKTIERSQLKEAILEELKRLKYISGDGQILAHGVNSFTAYYNQPNLHGDIQAKSNNRIRVMRSTNFTYGMAAQLERWKPLVK